MAANHSRQQIHDVEIGVKRDGTIVALHDRFLVDLGAYIRTHGVVVPELTVALLPGPYRIPHYECEATCVMTNKTPTGTYRGPGRYEGTFVRERVIDLVARELGLDPADVRRRNFIEPHEMPYDAGGAAIGQRTVYDCGNYGSAFEQALAGAGYEDVRKQQARQRADGRRVGIGIGVVLEKAGLGPWEYARVEIDGSGRAVVYSGIAAVGQGIETTLAQVCADELGLSTDDVTVVHGDSAQVPFGVGGFASRGAAVALPAAQEAARKVRAKILTVAASLLEAAPADLVLDGGRVHVRGLETRAVTLRQCARSAVPGPPGMEPGLYATHFFEAPKMTYPYGTHVAIVEVDLVRRRPRDQSDDRRRTAGRRAGARHRRRVAGRARLRRGRADPDHDVHGLSRPDRDGDAGDDAHADPRGDADTAQSARRQRRRRGRQLRRGRGDRQRGRRCAGAARCHDHLAAAVAGPRAGADRRGTHHGRRPLRSMTRRRN